MVCHSTENQACKIPGQDFIWRLPLATIVSGRSIHLFGFRFEYRVDIALRASIAFVLRC